MIRWTPDLEGVTGLGQAWAWPVRLDGLEAARALAASPARSCDFADAALLRHPGAGARRLLRRRLLRALVARAQDLRVEDVHISRSAEGAPRAQGAHVSIAARGDWAVLAVGPAPLGVDLEIAGEDPPPTDAEGPPWAVWTAREAYAKAAGVSLDEALAAQVVDVTADRVELQAGARRIIAARFERGEVVCAAVTIGRKS
jgi:phosphopantetheinyl transferase